jgi:hypothetical protein
MAVDQFFSKRNKKSAKPENTVLQVDSAENYRVQQQNEVQSAHWSKSQITVFTAFTWNAESKGYSCADISDKLDLNKYCVHTFLDKLCKIVSL